MTWLTQTPAWPIVCTRGAASAVLSKRNRDGAHRQRSAFAGSGRRNDAAATAPSIVSLRSETSDDPRSARRQAHLASAAHRRAGSRDAVAQDGSSSHRVGPRLPRLHHPTQKPAGLPPTDTWSGTGLAPLSFTSLSPTREPAESIRRPYTAESERLAQTARNPTEAAAIEGEVVEPAVVLTRSAPPAGTPAASKWATAMLLPSPITSSKLEAPATTFGWA